MSPWSADNTNSNNNTNETTSTVKEEVPRMNTTTTPTPQRLEQALESFVEDLEGLEGAVQRFEEALLELEEDRASVYRRLRSGEIPSLKLGSALKVRRADLEGYMKVKGRKHLRLVSEENGFRER